MAIMSRSAAVALLMLCALAASGSHAAMPLVLDASSFARGAIKIGSQRSLLSGTDSGYSIQIPAFLIPTLDPALCVGEGCCATESAASPYRMEHLNSSYLVSGGQPFTTFYMQLVSVGAPGHECDTMNIEKLWLDIDPLLSVKFVSFDGLTTNAAIKQDDFGLSVSPHVALSSIPARGLLMTITVAGAVLPDALCPTPDFMLGSGATGTCEVILSGSTPSKAGACCPYGLASPVDQSTPFVPAAPQCSSDIENGPYELTLESASTMFLDMQTAPGARFSNYTFVLTTSTGHCYAAGINSCCTMPLDQLDISIANGVSISSVSIDGVAHGNVGFAENSATHSIMSVRQMGVSGPGAVPSAGTRIVVTVQLDAGANAVPDLCRASELTPGTVGHCTYTLRAPEAAFFCCPHSTTASVDAPAPPPHGPAGLCVPMAQSCVRVVNSTYNNEGTAATLFDFLVGNNKGEAGCVSVDEVLTFKVLLQNGAAAELSASNAVLPTQVSYGPNSITWGYTPAAAGDGLHYQMTLSGTDQSTKDACLQGYPEQPDGTCVVVFQDADNAALCFVGFVTQSFESNLERIVPGTPSSDGPGSGSQASVIVPAILVPLIVIAAFVAAALWYRKKRTEHKYTAGGLTDPLTLAAGSGSQVSISLNE